MSGINLWEETLDKLKVSNKTIDDVCYIICQNYIIPIDEYKKIADCTYDNGYGLPVVNVDLKIVGDDWWLEREEYDGSEWFSFKQKPQIGKYFNGSLHDLQELLFGGDKHYYNDIGRRIK